MAKEYTFASKTDSNYRLAATNNNDVCMAPYKAGDPHQQWTLKGSLKSKFALQNKANAMYLAYDDEREVFLDPQVHYWKEQLVNSNNENTYRIFPSDDSDSNLTETKERQLDLEGWEGSAGQEWRQIPTKNSLGVQKSGCNEIRNTVPSIFDVEYTFSRQADNNYRLAATTNNDVYMAPSKAGDPHQQWKLKGSLKSKFALQNKANAMYLAYDHEGEVFLDPQVHYWKEQSVGPKTYRIFPSDDSDSNLTETKEGQLDLEVWESSAGQKWNQFPITNSPAVLESGCNVETRSKSEVEATTHLMTNCNCNTVPSNYEVQGTVPK